MTNIPFDNEARCSVCGAVGLNAVEREDIIIGDKVIGHTHFLVCECGHVITELEDFEGGYDD